MTSGYCKEIKIQITIKKRLKTVGFYKRTINI